MKTGRPTVKTPETRERLLKAAAAGYSSLAAIARAAGISEDTLLDWRKEDPSLDADLTAAREGALDKIEAAVLTKALEDAKLGLAVLKTRRPDGYDAARRVELTGKDGGPVLTAAAEKIAAMSDEELLAAIARLEGSAPQEG